MWHDYLGLYMAVYGGLYMGLCRWMVMNKTHIAPPLVIPKAAGSCFITGKVDCGGDWMALNAAFGPLITPS